MANSIKCWLILRQFFGAKWILKIGTCVSVVMLFRYSSGAIIGRIKIAVADRHVAANLAEQISILEAHMTGQGLTVEYLAGIRANIQPFSLVNYLAALKRTLNSRSKSAATFLQRG